MSGFQEHYHKSLRLGILRILAEAPGYKLNTAVLHTAATSLGFHVARDVINTQCDWLSEQALVEIEDLGKVRVVAITQRGLDVASGLANITGVDRPSPKA